MNRYMKKMAALLAAMMFSLSLFGCEALDTTLPPQETQEQTAQTKSEKNTADAVKRCWPMRQLQNTSL